MTDTASPPPTGHLSDTLEEMRVSVAAEGTQKGLAGAIQKAILKLLAALLALLAELQAGRLADTSRSCAATPPAEPSTAHPGDEPATDPCAAPQREGEICDAGSAPSAPNAMSGECAGDADRGTDSAPLCALRGSEYFTAEDAEKRRGSPHASSARSRGSRFAAQAHATAGEGHEVGAMAGCARHSCSVLGDWHDGIRLGQAIDFLRERLVP